MVIVCLAMSLMLFIGHVYMRIVIVKLFGCRPEKKHKWEPMKEIPKEALIYPMVLVEIPKDNEKEVIC